MREIANILRLTLNGLGPRTAFSSVSRLFVWLATLGCWGATILAYMGIISENPGRALLISALVSLTPLLTALSEATAENLAQRQTLRLRTSRESIVAKRLESEAPDSPQAIVPAYEIRPGDIIMAAMGDIIPVDGEVIAGTATIDESALTGESAPVIRQNSDNQRQVTAGTRVISDWIIFRASSESRESFLDRMINIIEGTRRQKSASEAAIDATSTTLTVVFALATAAFVALAYAWSLREGAANPLGIVEALALFVCLSPSTLGALLPIVGTSGMTRLSQANLIAKNAQAVEAAGNVDTLLIDKTGTITLGNRQACDGKAMTDPIAFWQDAILASWADNTPEGRSIISYARTQLGGAALPSPSGDIILLPFSAQAAMSGVDIGGRQLRKGSQAAIDRWLKQRGIGAGIPTALREWAQGVSAQGGTPLIVADERGALGGIALKDKIKEGLKERFALLRQLGINTIMITGDNAMTAATVAAQAGVDDFVAEATPERKLELIRQLQAQGHLVAMTGDGTNDAPALAQADVALAMNNGTTTAKEAGNLIDLDNNPTKITQAVSIGKQNLITIGALTTFSLANDTLKFVALMPALLTGILPQLRQLDIIGFANPHQALLATLIFNALIIALLLPMAIAGSPFRAAKPHILLARHLIIYGIGGVLAAYLLTKGIALCLS
jgi:potassium-transporting ATPase ATP-binding subunit